MSFINKILKSDIFILVLIYFFLSYLLFSHYKFFVDSSDAMQYIVIAQKYSAGNFQDAINSFWSPLFSWLLAIFLKLGAEPFSAAKILQLIIGGFVIIGVDKLLLNRHSKFIYFSIMLATLAFVLYCALVVLTPDLLFLSFSIWYLVFLNEKSFYPTKNYSLITISILGALLYFSKSVGFIFFLLSFSVFNFFLYRKKEIPFSKLLMKYLFTLTLFFSISSIWIFFISAKEHRFVISSAASYNLHNIGPVSNPDVFGEVRHPYSWRGLIAPPEKSSLSAWEEPEKMPLETWSVFSGKENLFHYFKVIVKNLLSIRSFYFGLDAGTVLCLTLLLLWCSKKEDAKNIFRNNISIFILCFCCTLPYIFLLVIERYLWINAIAIAVLGFYTFEKLIPVYKKTSLLFLFLFIALFVKNPLIELKKYYDSNKNIFKEKEEISKYISGRTASVFSENENPDENYAKSSLITFFAHSQYYGIMHVQQEEKNVKDELKKYSVNYLLSWNNEIKISKSICSDSITFPSCELKIYKLK